ncbi:MAG TPA: hypothetical protein VMJ32_07765 [Pirellulales bacterium]|nr:hypothetical protein [Pirellulales bacterium]
MGKPSSLEDYKQITSFQTLRKTLLQAQFSAELERPLAYWALPGDRRLPLAFLGRTLQDLLQTSFEELAATPGIGQKKISSLMKLLSRVTKRKVPADSQAYGSLVSERKLSAVRSVRSPREFDPQDVSEADWEQWRDTVRRHGIGTEKLGRLAPSLQWLPTVIWHMPLSTYLDYSIAEMRQLKTHGEKRVRVILEVFHAVHEALSQAPIKSHLTPRLFPKFVTPLELWVAAALEMPDGLSHHSVRELLAVPITDQIQIDCGQTIARLAEGRLGLHGVPQSVRIQSKRMGVTRARVYQLLGECQQVMAVRWPEGRLLLTCLRQKLETLLAAPEGLKLLCAVTELYFPDDEEMLRRKLEKLDEKKE